MGADSPRGLDRQPGYFSEWPEPVSDEALGAITQLISQAQDDAPEYWDRIYAQLYDELHALAKSQIRRHWSSSHRSPTSLISRAWLRVIKSDPTYKSKSHLIAILARAMRFALIDEARRFISAPVSDGGAETSSSWHEHEIDAAQKNDLEEMLAIHEALTCLADTEPRLATVVEMRYFAGMNDSEISEALDVTPRTVHRDWVRARAFLSSMLQPES